MKIKTRLIRKVFEKNGFFIFGCVPLEDNNKIKLNDYGNFTITGNLGYLTEGEDYVLELEEGDTSKYGTQYRVLSVPSMENLEFTNDNEYSYLCQITTPRQAKYINEAYPNFIQLVIDGRLDEIDLKNIYNVKEARFKYLVREINSKWKYFKMITQLRQYEVTMDECESLGSLYSTIEATIEAVEANPYYCLIDILGRGFMKVDKLLKTARPDLLMSIQRIEQLLKYVLKENEFSGDTKTSARDMAYKAVEIAPETVSLLKETAINSSMIYYDEATNDMALMSTYIAECEIASRIKDLLKSPKHLDIDYLKYNSIDGNDLTDEQMQILKIATEQNIGMLLGGGGSGKSFSISALINMLDDNGLTYTLLTPTGTSAKVLSNYTNRTASTIHKRCMRQDKIDTDFLIVDEFSFVGVDVMMMLIRSTEPNVKIIIVADDAQLPSISAGNILSDMIKSEKIPTATLTKVFRYGIGGIDTVASDTRRGRPYIGLNGLPIYTNDNGNDDYKFIPISNNPIGQILECYDELRKKYSDEDILILSPFNVGDMGTYAINSAIQNIYNPLKPNQKQLSYQRNGHTVNFRIGDKVLNTVNWYDALSYDEYDRQKKLKDDFFFDDEDAGIEDDPTKVDIMNGAFGKIIGIEDDNIVVKFDDDVVVYTNRDVNKLILGNACSTHKAQGNQALAVISITHKQHQKMLHRALLYVANSRARQKLIEIGDPAVINNALKIVITNQRNTFLGSLLLTN